MRFKQLAYLLVDILLIVLALLLAFFLRFGVDIPDKYREFLLFLIPVAIVIKVAVFYASGFYRQLWKYASLREGLRLVQGISASSLILLGALFFIRRVEIPRAVLVIDWLLTLGLIGTSRFVTRAKKDFFTSPSQAKNIDQKNVIIVGAGEAGSILVKHMQRHPDRGYKPIAFLDDDPSKQGLMIHGVRVIGNTRAIPRIMAEYLVDEIVLAIPSASSKDRRRIALECRELGIPCKTVPDFSELVDGEASILQIRDIDPKELLGRKEVEIDLKETADCYKDKVILITGAAGSIGSELCRQATFLEPAKIVAVDISENGLYHLEEEMTSWLDDDKALFETHIMDVRNKAAVTRVFEKFKPQVVFHAAAYKHVPIMQKHPIEAMENNFLGTRTMIEVAKEYTCERFVFISTDKAVNPTSVMGLSKYFSEQAVKLAASDSDTTKFMAVRFGNVLASNGSVIPKFKRQISNGEAVTVTHPDITRYFMTIHEAVHLVIQATAMGSGGEIFVLNMGEPVRILDLAKSMIRLFGFEPGKDIKIVYTGLRPGEKMFEELFAENETVNNTKHPQIFEVLSEFDKELVSQILNEVESIINEGDNTKLSDFLHQGYLSRISPGGKKSYNYLR
ncbi:MAG: polysaccharide biosynthesis protein [Firmicutes bacterium]|nr:polysaccharide biosynthesis protein [Bacillota bacterium]